MGSIISEASRPGVTLVKAYLTTFTRIYGARLALNHVEVHHTSYLSLMITQGVKFLKSKDEAFMAFKHFKTEVEKESGRCIKVIRTDNGLEFVNKVFLKYCKDEGIVMHNTIVRSPQQNGVAERMNRTLVERTRCMLSNAGVGKELWAEAINTACYLVNRSPSGREKTSRGLVPEEVVIGLA